MRAIIVFYSGSGNNYKVSRAIYRGIQRVMDCEVSSVCDLDPKNMDRYDLIGIGSPIWYCRETANIRRFIYTMPDLTGKLSFIFSVHGTKPIGIFHSMVPAIKRKGLTIIGWNDWFGANYYTLHEVKPYPLDGHPDSIDLKEAEDWGKEIAQRALRVFAGDKGSVPEIPGGPGADPLFQPSGVMKFFGRDEKPHRKINMDRCQYPECTLCIDNCVAKALDFTVDPPLYNIKTCINCSLCDRMCPQGAIEIPDEELSRIRTMKIIDMKRCKHPECTVCTDHCPMDAIDFSMDPPVFRRSCEGCDLCWVICPQGAIEITNLELTHRISADRASARWTSPIRTKILASRKSEGRFRQLVQENDLGTDGSIMDIRRYPRFNIEELMQESPLPPYYGRPYNDNPA